jgi:cobalt/nickel transport system permease protein
VAEPGRSQALLAGGLGAAFALSAVTRPALLGAALALAAIAFRRGLVRQAGRVARAVLPISLGLAAASALAARLAGGAWPDLAPHALLVLRAVTISLVVLSVLARADLLRAVSPSPTATRLLVLTLAQVHALRLVATESLLGLRSRMPRKPGALDVLRGAGGITAALLALSLRNARDVADAMRSRGF